MPLLTPRQRSRFRADAVAPSSDPAGPSRRQLLAAGCACCAAMFAPADVFGAENAPSPEVENHLAAARAAAGDDLGAYLVLGAAAGPPSGLPTPSIEELMALPAPPPGRAFDNLYFVGSKWVSSWAITTSDGIILIDAMDNDEEADRIIEQGLRKLGLDPAHIRIIIVTHGHGDHYGGVGVLKARYNPQIVMSDADWRMMETKLEFDLPSWGRPPKRDVTVADGDKVTLGDASVDFLITPGHTMGTISPLFNVRQGGKTHRALLWGGAAFNFGRKPERLRAYTDAAVRTRDIAKAQDVDVFISNHNAYDSAVAKVAAIESGAATNPFLLGAPAVQRALTVISECAEATLAYWKT